MSDPIKIGLLTNGITIKGWQYSIIEKLLQDDRFELCAVIENAEPAQSTIAKIRGRWAKLPWLIINKIEARLSRWLFGQELKGLEIDVDDNIELACLGMPFQTLRVLPQVSPSGLIHRLSDEDIKQVEGLSLDVVLRFGFNILKGDILTVPRFGIWSFHHGDNAVNRGGPPGFWEVYENNPFSGATLQVLTEDLDNGIVIRKGLYSSYPFSWNENRRRLTWKSRNLMIDALRELATTGSVPKFDDVRSRPFNLYWHPLMMAPGPLVTAVASFKLFVRMAKRALEKLLWREQWQLALCRGPLQGKSMRKLEVLVPPDGSFWADPFIVEREGAKWLFFEDFNFSSGKGGISCVRLTDEGYDNFHQVMDLPYHLSYPFLFEHRGALYMIPETMANRTIEMWKCVHFPAQWEKTRTIFEDVAAVDATLFEHDGRWWMFTTQDRTGIGDMRAELFIYHTDDPVQGEWQAHLKNPVLVNGRWARMAGGFIHLPDGKLIRCAQKGGPTYGSGMHFMEITRLTTEIFEERRAETIQPDWRPDLVGIHHCHHLPDMTVFDMKVRRTRFR